MKKLFTISFLIVVCYFIGTLTFHINRKDCPLRESVPSDAFPAKEGLVGVQSVNATSQFARKYEINCQSCHTAFPRLNYFGEQFRRNGYQMPDTTDGDENKTPVGDNLFMDKVGNLFGLRVNFTPAKYTTNALQSNNKYKGKLQFGNPNWLQIFTAGSIFKNTSIFIETEIQSDKDTAKAYNNWMILGYHNIFDTSLLNVRVGKLAVMDNFSQSGRLRMMPEPKIDAFESYKSAGAGTGNEDQATLTGPQPGLEVYGYKGPFLYSVGVVNGKKWDDTNKYKNFFATLRADIQEGEFAGSNISSWGYYGWDTKNAAVSSNRDRFWRTAGGANLRWKDLDVIGAFMYGKDDNWDLATGLVQKTKSLSGQAGYLLTPKWFTALQYDWLDGTAATQDLHKFSQSIAFMPRENMRIDLISALELKERTNGRRHQFMINVRSIF